MRKEDVEKVCKCFKDENPIRMLIIKYIVNGKDKKSKEAIKKYCKETPKNLKPGYKCPCLNEFWVFTKKHPEFPNCGLCGAINRDMLFEINEEQEKYLIENNQEVHEQFWNELEDMDVEEIYVCQNPKSIFLKNSRAVLGGKKKLGLAMYSSMGTSINNALANLFKKLIYFREVKYKITTDEDYDKN